MRTKMRLRYFRTLERQDVTLASVGSGQGRALKRLGRLSEAIRRGSERRASACAERETTVFAVPLALWEISRAIER